MIDKINIGDWKRENKYNNHSASLKIKGTNILVGYAREDFSDKTKTFVSCSLSNISGESVVLYKPFSKVTDAELTKEWKKLFKNSILKRY